MVLRDLIKLCIRLGARSDVARARGENRILLNIHGGPWQHVEKTPTQMTVTQETWGIINPDSAINNHFSGGSWFFGPLCAKTTDTNLTTLQTGLRREKAREEELLHVLFASCGCMSCLLLCIDAVWNFRRWGAAAETRAFSSGRQVNSAERCNTEQTSGVEQENMLLYTLHTHSPASGGRYTVQTVKKKGKLFWSIRVLDKKVPVCTWISIFSLAVGVALHAEARVYFRSFVALLMQRRSGPWSRRSWLPQDEIQEGAFFFSFQCMRQNSFFPMRLSDRVHDLKRSLFLVFIDSCLPEWLSMEWVVDYQLERLSRFFVYI